MFGEEERQRLRVREEESVWEGTGPFPEVRAETTKASPIWRGVDGEKRCAAAGWAEMTERRCGMRGV